MSVGRPAVRAAVLLLFSIYAGCSGEPRPIRGDADTGLGDDPRYGGTISVGVPYDPAFLSPFWFGGSADARNIGQNVLYTPLFRPDADLEPVPVLVERWDTVRFAPDSLALTLTLRQDVTWHDGVPTTAEDVAFAYRRARDPAAGLPHGGFFDRFDPVPEIVDRFTVRFRLRAHNAFLSNLVLLLPAPKHLLEDVPPSELIGHPIARRPVGNGPYRFVRHVPDQEWVFERSEAHPPALGGAPFVDRLVLRVIPDPTIRLTELMTGGIDVMLGVTAQQAGAIESTDGVRLLEAPSPHFTFLAWNTRLPMFADSRVRRALTLGIDRPALVESVRGGRDIPGKTTIRPIDWMYVEGPAPPVDRSVARTLLESAGWTDRDGDGVRENESGVPLRFTITASAAPDNTDVLAVLQSQLREIGADLRPRLLEPTAALAVFFGTTDDGGVRRREFDAALSGFSFFGPKDDAPLFHSRYSNGSLALTGFHDPEADDLMDRLAVALDRTEALPLWREYEALLDREAPVTVLSYRGYLVGIRERMRGVVVHPAGEFVSVGQWWIERDPR